MEGEGDARAISWRIRTEALGWDQVPEGGVTQQSPGRELNLRNIPALSEGTGEEELTTENQSGRWEENGRSRAMKTRSRGQRGPETWRLKQDQSRAHVHW